MNERIIELAEEAGLLNCISGEAPQNYVVHMEAGLAEIKKFAELVRADEREACAKLAADKELTRKERERARMMNSYRPEQEVK